MSVEQSAEWQHFFLTHPDKESALLTEIYAHFHKPLVTKLPRGVMQVRYAPWPKPSPILSFVRQSLPDAELVTAPSINALARALFDRVKIALKDHQGSWQLHVFSEYGESTESGGRRAQLIRKAFLDILKEKQKRLLKLLEAEESAKLGLDHALVQCMLLSPEQECISIMTAGRAHELRHAISPFPAGVFEISQDKRPPSRAFKKLVEAQKFFGTSIGTGETCVDLGACPGGWTWVALQGGARVTAIDRSPLDPSLMKNPKVNFIKGNAFTYTPERPVDWLVCDVIAFPDKVQELIAKWIQGKLCKGFFVTIKFRGQEDYPILTQLSALVAEHCSEFALRHLYNNKNEVTAMGLLN